MDCNGRLGDHDYHPPVRHALQLLELELDQRHRSLKSLRRTRFGALHANDAKAAESTTLSVGHTRRYLTEILVMTNENSFLMLSDRRDNLIRRALRCEITY